MWSTPRSSRQAHRSPRAWADQSMPEQLLGAAARAVHTSSWMCLYAPIPQRACMAGLTQWHSDGMGVWSQTLASETTFVDID